jgi:hypothetical protein
MDISPVKLGLVLALVAVGAGLLWFSMRSLDPERDVAGIHYDLVCKHCGKTGTWTTAELNRMVARGECVSPEYHTRRFKCPACGAMELIMDQRSYDDQVRRKE